MAATIAKPMKKSTYFLGSFGLRLGKYGIARTLSMRNVPLHA
jgi:hypothetical protein